MLVFAKCFRRAFLSCGAPCLCLFANFIETSPTVAARQLQQSGAQDPGTSGEAANFDAFLDAHPDIDAQLRTNPLLINDQKWVQGHPELILYFDQHPQAKSEIAGSLSYFIRREGRRASREARERNENLRKEEVANFHQFLNSNPQISDELSGNPSLIKDPRYVDEHPGLQAYLYDHPQAKKDLQDNPGQFLQRLSQPNNVAKKGAEDQKAQREPQPTASNPPPKAAVASRQQPVTHHQPHGIDDTGGNRHRGPTAQRAEQASHTQPTTPNDDTLSFDRFLDRHPDISQQLSADPSLIGDAKYLEQHPGLRAYLNDHPTVKKQVQETPNYFARREVQTPYDALEARRPAEPATAQPAPAQPVTAQPATAPPATAPVSGSPPSQVQSVANVTNVSVLTASEIASFDQFLAEHKKINKDLEKDPARVKDSKYVKKNKDLQNYLNQHAGVRDELVQNPAYFMNRRNRHELSAAERSIEPRNAENVNSASSTTRLSQKDLRTTDRFLEKHKGINKDLEKNPSLAVDPHYIKKHKDFREFLKQNPDINAAIGKDPVAFMQNQHDRFEQMHQKM